jgi:hypothetical protein
VYGEALTHLQEQTAGNPMLLGEMLRLVIEWCVRRRPKDEQDRWKQAAITAARDAERRKEMTDMATTIAEAYIEEGEARGEARGELKGMLKERRSLLIKFARARFGHPNADAEATINAISDLDRLDILVDRFNSATSWDDLVK